LAESIIQVRRGQLDPRVANSVGHLASILLGALQQGTLEERLARIEAALELEDNTNVKAIQDAEQVRTFCDNFHAERGYRFR
jgi:hypothetical protein